MKPSTNDYDTGSKLLLLIQGLYHTGQRALGTPRSFLSPGPIAPFWQALRPHSRPGLPRPTAYAWRRIPVASSHLTPSPRMWPTRARKFLPSISFAGTEVSPELQLRRRISPARPRSLFIRISKLPSEVATPPSHQKFCAKCSPYLKALLLARPFCSPLSRPKLPSQRLLHARNLLSISAPC